jgi:thymidylate synthase (FAD)
MDSQFKIQTIAATVNPQQVIWAAMHQCYSDRPTVESNPPNEERAGKLVIKNLLAGNRGHFGPLEHPVITVNVIGFPHSTMQQLRTHRVGITFDSQSFRYTSERILAVGTGAVDAEGVFYLRPVGEYSDRKGCKYTYTQADRAADIGAIAIAARRYAAKIDRGFSEEQARGTIPFDVRQHFVMSCNVRSLMHLLDLRWKKDAQLEAQQFSALLFEQFMGWCPAIASWYEKERAGRAKLSP